MVLVVKIVVLLDIEGLNSSITTITNFLVGMLVPIDNFVAVGFGHSLATSIDLLERVRAVSLLDSSRIKLERDS